MRTFLVKLIPIIALIFFVLVMLSGSYLKRPTLGNDNIPKSIDSIIQDINNENWEAARNNTEELSKSWSKTIRRTQFSSERDEINGFSFNIARLRGAIMARDKADALMELKEAYEHWDELGK